MNYLDGQVVAYSPGEVIQSSETTALAEASLFGDSLVLDDLENLIASDVAPSDPNVSILDIFVPDDAIDLESLLPVGQAESPMAKAGASNGDAFAGDLGLASSSELLSSSAHENNSVVPFTFSDIAAQLEYESINFV